VRFNKTAAATAAVAMVLLKTVMANASTYNKQKHNSDVTMMTMTTL